MAVGANNRRAFALTFVCALVLTVAAEAAVKDGTRTRLSNAEVEEQLQVRASFGYPFPLHESTCGRAC